MTAPAYGYVFEANFADGRSLHVVAFDEDGAEWIASNLASLYGWKSPITNMERV
jgi:hypothetical protein